MSSKLLSGGKHYELLINWEKRLKIEIPFLSENLKDIKPRIRNILEIGSATGRHTELLQKELGFHMTGVDIDESMIEEAKKRVPEAHFIASDFLDMEDQIYDSIISLGNSLGLIAQSSNYSSVIKRCSQLLRKPNGILIFQILNTDIIPPRNGWSNPRSISTKEGDFIFLRGFTTTEKFIHPEILTLFKPNEETQWIMKSTGRANIPRVDLQTITSILENNDFRSVKTYGSYAADSYDPTNSLDMIFVAST